METTIVEYTEERVKAEIRSFVPENGTVEYHVMLHVEPNGDLFSAQQMRICSAEKKLRQGALDGCTLLFKRYFFSDIANQYSLLPKEREACAVSCVGQPPLDGSKIACWMYLVRGEVTTECGDNSTCMEHNGYQHVWQVNMLNPVGTSEKQALSILKEYTNTLRRHGATLADNCIRTWFYVRDVDTQYAGMVRARKEFFAQEGLTEQTHYIASTGIGGAPTDTRALVQMDAYAVRGLRPEQQQYLYAPTHLNPTCEYGVTFERGTAVHYGDRNHIFISGTASINNRGEVMYVGDIEKQTSRMWENVGKLLEEAGAGYEDIALILVYLRDPADYPATRERFKNLAPGTPIIITLAPVCRPSWLIEMECIATKATHHPEYNVY